MSNIQLANNLRFLRTKHKLTQDDLSSLLNISRQAYSNYETSKRTPDLDSLLHISRFYRISIDELVLDNLQSTYHTSALKTGEEYIPYVVMAKEKNTGNSIYLSREELDRNGITDRILRLSVGIEGAEDLIADLEAVLKKIK